MSEQVDLTNATVEKDAPFSSFFPDAEHIIATNSRSNELTSKIDALRGLCTTARFSPEDQMIMVKLLDKAIDEARIPQSSSTVALKATTTPASTEKVTPQARRFPQKMKSTKQKFIIKSSAEKQIISQAFDPKNSGEIPIIHKTFDHMYFESR